MSSRRTLRSLRLELFLTSEEVAQGLLRDGAANFRNRARQGNVFRADFDAVLSITAFLDSTVSHKRREPLALQGSTGWVRVEQPYL